MISTPKTTDRAVKPRSRADGSGLIWGRAGSITIERTPRHVRMLSNRSKPTAPNMMVGIHAAKMG